MEVMLEQGLERGKYKPGSCLEEVQFQGRDQKKTGVHLGLSQGRDGNSVSRISLCADIQT